MSAVVGVFLIFMALIAVVAFGHHATTSYIEKIHSQRNRKQQLRVTYRNLMQNVTDLKEAEMSLARQVEGFTDYSLGALTEGGDLITGISKPKGHKAPAVFHTVVDVLLAEKLLRPEDLAKAENYKQQSKSPYAIDEILSLLGYVHSDVIERIKRRYPNLS